MRTTRKNDVQYHNLSRRLRELPPVCLILALCRLVSGRLRLSGQYLHRTLGTGNGSVFRVFRNLVTFPECTTPDPVVFIVRFKFSQLSHRANRLASVIPMLLIAGFPGFHHKIYAVNPENGYWTGMYQWVSEKQLERYKRSFVFRMMKRRALPDSLHLLEFPGKRLSDYVDHHLVPDFRCPGLCQRHYFPCTYRGPAAVLCRDDLAGPETEKTLKYMKSATSIQKSARTAVIWQYQLKNIL
jgi:hypothetical protein